MRRRRSEPCLVDHSNETRHPSCRRTPVSSKTLAKKTARPSSSAWRSSSASESASASWASESASDARSPVGDETIRNDSLAGKADSETRRTGSSASSFRGDGDAAFRAESSTFPPRGVNAAATAPSPTAPSPLATDRANPPKLPRRGSPVFGRGSAVASGPATRFSPFCFSSLTRFSDESSPSRSWLDPRSREGAACVGMMASASSSESSPKSSSAAPSASPEGFSALSAKSTRRSGASDAARFALATASGDDRPSAPTLPRGDLRRASRAPGDPAWFLPRAESMSIAAIARGRTLDPPRRGRRRVRSPTVARASVPHSAFSRVSAHVPGALAETPDARPVASLNALARTRPARRSPTDSAPSPRSASRDTARPSRRGRVCLSVARRSRGAPIAASESAGGAVLFQIRPRFSRARGKTGFANPGLVRDWSLAAG